MIPSSATLAAAGTLVLLASAGLAVLPGVQPATAAPNMEEGGEGSASSVAPIPCERRFVYSGARGHCVRLEPGVLPDAELYTQGRALALAGRYLNALDVLGAIGKPDAKALTMVGYSERKAGRLKEGIATYQRALALEPDNLDAREYLGESYAEAGDLEKAGAELARIKAICGGTECEQYKDLAEAIESAKGRGGK
jgi:tetratricopeptide (TPR) repeat protein